jgi:hypothetical protein
VTALVATGAAAACGPSSIGQACESISVPADLQLVFVDDRGVLHDVADGAQVPLIRAPQGGRIMLVGARVRGGDDCYVQMTGALRDPCNGRVIGLEQRPIPLVDRGDGWGEPRDPDQLASMPNVALCPTTSASQDVDGHPFELEVVVETATGVRLGAISAMVVPTCLDDGCRCECDLTPYTDCEIDEPDAATACPSADAATVGAF